MVFTTQSKKLNDSNDIDKFNSIDFHIITKNEFYINQNDKEGILGLGWSHPNYFQKFEK